MTIDTMLSLKTENKQPVLKEVGLPVIREGESLLRVEVAGVCRTDIDAAFAKIERVEGVTLGHEFSSIVIKSDVFKVGKRVAVFPFEDIESSNKMLGVFADGAFSEYVKVKNHQIYSVNFDKESTALLEPLAASMAILKAFPKVLDDEVKVCLIGSGRIADLTKRVFEMKFSNVKLKIFDEKNLNLADNFYDYIIETKMNQEIISLCLLALKYGGTLILKSRPADPVMINTREVVLKNVSLEAVDYAPFDEAIRWVEEKLIDLSPFLGRTYSLENYEEAFVAASNSEQKKIFLRP